MNPITRGIIWGVVTSAVIIVSYVDFYLAMHGGTWSGLLQ